MFFPLIASMLVSGGACALTLAGTGGPLRALLGTVAVLVCPGLALVGALRIRERPWPELAALAIGASIAICIAIGLGLNLVGAPLGTTELTVGLTAATILLGSIGLLRFPERQIGIQRPAAASIAMALLALVVAGAAGWLAHLQADRDQQKVAVTQLWLLRHPDAPHGVSVGIRRFSDGDRNFDLRLSAGSCTVSNDSTGPLGGGNTWQRSFTLPNGGRCQGRVMATLSHPGSNTAYRRAYLASDG
jgi:hypothetical protein